MLSALSRRVEEKEKVLPGPCVSLLFLGVRGKGGGRVVCTLAVAGSADT